MKIITAVRGGLYELKQRISRIKKLTEELDMK
jgi:hypothetical protein